MATREPIRFVVPDAEDGARFDRVVARGAGVSRRQARLWIRTGRVEVAGKVLKILSRAVRAGRQIQVRPDAVGSTSARPQLALLMVDRHLAAVNKPSGLLSCSGGDRPSVETLLPEILPPKSGNRELCVVHRLDAATSGVLVTARTAKASRVMGEAFRRGEVQKDYLCLCAGHVAQRQEINRPIARFRGRQWGVRSEGKPAATLVIPIARAGGMTLVHARPRTGRTHQIRVHLAHIGHPLVGDGLYGGSRYTEANPPEVIPRVMLHALRLRFAHPANGAPVVLVAPPAEDFVTECRRAGLVNELTTWVEGLDKR